MGARKLLFHGGTLLGIPTASMVGTYSSTVRPDIENIKTTEEGKTLKEINQEGDAGYIFVKFDDGTYKIGLSCPKGGVFRNQCGEKGKWKIETFKKVDETSK